MYIAVKVYLVSVYGTWDIKLWLVSETEAPPTTLFRFAHRIGAWKKRRCNHLKGRAKKWLVKAYMVKVAVVVVTRFTAPSPYITQLLPFVI